MTDRCWYTVCRDSKVNISTFLEERSGSRVARRSCNDTKNSALRDNRLEPESFWPRSHTYSIRFTTMTKAKAGIGVAGRRRGSGVLQHLRDQIRVFADK